VKIHQVTMTGFGPYRGTETVDFDAFDDDGIFLISGRTGAGKTSILDAVTYALFGSIPRYDGSAGEKVRSDHIGPTDPCRVTVELSTADGRFRVTRSPAHRRPKQRGEGTTLAPPTFELARRDGDEWEVVESKTGNAEVRIEEIVRLSAKQFLQVILLAQGQFQEFLVATSDKRRELLRMLFDTRRFSDYSAALDARARELETRLGSSATAVVTNGTSIARVADVPVPDDVDLEHGTGVREWVEALVQQQRVVTDEAATVAEAAQVEVDAARHELEAARSVADRQRRRQSAVVRQGELEAEQESIDADGERLAAARRSALVWHAVEADRVATARHEEAVLVLERARDVFESLLPDTPVEPADLTDLVQRLTEQQGLLRESAALEQRLPRLQAEARAAAAAVVEFDAQVQVDVASRDDLRTELAALVETWDDLEAGAARLPTTQQAVTEVTARLRSAEAARRTDVEIETAAASALEAGRAVTAASARRDHLRQAQTAGYAGELAQALQTGEACPVCGSTSHPHPAARAADHVDDATIAAAELAYDDAVALSRTADQVVVRLTTRREGELAAAGGRTVEQIADELVQARVDQDAAQQAAEAWSRAKATRTRLEADIARLDVAIEQAGDRRKTLATTESVAATTADRAQESLTEARGEHTSVAEHLAEIEARRRAAQALLAATTGLAESAEHVTAAASVLREALTEHEIADVATAEAARLTSRQRAELQSRVADHEAELKAVSSALAADDLQSLPVEPVDLEQPGARFAHATEEGRHAVAAHSAAAQQLRTLDDLATEIVTALDAAADLREQFDVVHRLASTVRGQTPNTMKMALETFALAAELEEIVRAANSRLTAMTGGRYEFLHSDALAGRGAQSGLALDVLDAYTGETRPPQSLSGGEKFQASLALALGLAEVLTNRAGGIRLDTLFIDEGFGSLDADTLETTMTTLDNLREGGRTIGLISHVEAMKESIPAQLFVDRTEGGWSTIRTSRPA
jgi:exonuclease SbcC